jgi:hypothetical protein
LCFGENISFEHGGYERNFDVDIGEGQLSPLAFGLGWSTWLGDLVEALAGGMAPVWNCPQISRIKAINVHSQE